MKTEEPAAKSAKLADSETDDISKSEEAGRAGMDEAELRRLHAKLQPLKAKTMTVSEPPPRTTQLGSPLELSRVHR